MTITTTAVKQTKTRSENINQYDFFTQMHGNELSLDSLEFPTIFKGVGNPIYLFISFRKCFPPSKKIANIILTFAHTPKQIITLYFWINFPWWRYLC